MSKRFSKNAMLERLEARLTVLEGQHGFKRGDGWAVVNGKDIETVIAFGRYDECRDLIEDINEGL